MAAVVDPSFSYECVFTCTLTDIPVETIGGRRERPTFLGVLYRFLDTGWVARTCSVTSAIVKLNGEDSKHVSHRDYAHPVDFPVWVRKILDAHPPALTLPTEVDHE